MVTGIAPSIFAAARFPGSNVPVVVGSIIFGVGVVASISACFTRETYRVHLHDLGRKGAPEVSREEYERIRAAV